MHNKLATYQWTYSNMTEKSYQSDGERRLSNIRTVPSPQPPTMRFLLTGSTDRLVMQLSAPVGKSYRQINVPQSQQNPSTDSLTIVIHEHRKIGQFT